MLTLCLSQLSAAFRRAAALLAASFTPRTAAPSEPLVVNKSVFHAIKLPGPSGGRVALITLSCPRVFLPNTQGSWLPKERLCRSGWWFAAGGSWFTGVCSPPGSGTGKTVGRSWGLTGRFAAAPFADENGKNKGPSQSNKCSRSEGTSLNKRPLDKESKQSPDTAR